MNANSLFKVLVLGGAMLSAGAVLAEGPAPVSGEPPVVVEEVGGQAFCAPAPSDTCELNEEGQSVPKQGLECCWNTTCDAGG